MIFNNFFILLVFSALFANSDIYNLIEQTNKAIKTKQEISALNLYEAAKSAYSIEEYSDAISFMRYIRTELDTDDYVDEMNDWVRMTKEIEILTNRYENDSSEKDSVILELEELRNTYDYYKNCDLVEENIEELKSGENYTEYVNCAYIEYNIGKVLMKEEDYSEALKYYSLSNLLNPGNQSYQKSLNSVLSYYIKEASDYIDFKDYASAIDNYLTALEYMSIDNSNYYPLLYKISQAYYYDKEEDEALLYLKKLVDIDIEKLSLRDIEDEYPDEDDYNALYLMGECYRKLENYDNAIKSYTCALNAKDDARAYYKRGKIYYEINNYEDAINDFEDAIYLKENYHQVYESLGMLYIDQDDNKSAVENLQLAVDYSPRNFQCWHRLSRLYNDMSTEYKDTEYSELAKECAEECLLIKRSYAPAYFEIGRAERALDNPFSAIANFEKARKSSQYRKSADAEIKEIQEELSN